MTAPNTGSQSSPPQPDPGLPPPRKLAAEPTLREAIRRGWDWIVFVWQLGQRLGGWRGVAHTLSTVSGLLVGRLLTQLGLGKKS